MNNPKKFLDGVAKQIEDYRGLEYVKTEMKGYYTFLAQGINIGNASFFLLHLIL